MKFLKIKNSIFWLVILGVTMTGCKDNGTNATDDHEEKLTATLTLSDDHVHTLSEITYTVEVTDDHGNVVTDLEIVEVQRKGHGADDWRGTELELSGNVFTGSYTFMSSGEYDLRVAGMTHDSEEMEVLYEMDDHFNVGRAHVVEGNYRIEYEHFPGHMHEGDQAEVKFWVFESEEDASGERPPVSNLEELHIHGDNPDGSTEHHDETVHEEEDGIYVTDHTFMGGGEAHMGMHFTDSLGTEIEAEFSFEVSHGH